MAQNLTTDLIGEAPTKSNEEIKSILDEAFRQKAVAEGVIVAYLGESDRRATFRDEGATSTEAWATERFGISTATARSLARVGEKSSDLPHLVRALCQGDITFDKMRALADVATPRTDRRLCDQAKVCSVRQLLDVARAVAQDARARSQSTSEHERRYLRFNDEFRTLSVQLPPDSYAETRTCLEARAKKISSDGETPWDQRLCDGFLELIRSSFPGASSRATTGSPHFVVAHVPLDALVDGSGHPCDLAGDLEQDGLIDTQTVQRIACDATIAVAVDDDVGHTMYEGRAQRFPTDAQRREVKRRDRRCRFPGCPNDTFTNVHHIVPWKPDGRTDLDNLALACEFHHHLVHSKGWSMTGNANEDLTIVGPTGRVMTSRPDPRWTRTRSL
ncbi:MAG TPA: DUF222 domain-containing protein [Acidimicrobiales bacterium]|jgi:hypothetical protein|nr:DUF222 domain-containing protein [Acidimicrobiales bacterium]